MLVKSVAAKGADPAKICSIIPTNFKNNHEKNAALYSVARISISKNAMSFVPKVDRVRNYSPIERRDNGGVAGGYDRTHFTNPDQRINSRDMDNHEINFALFNY